MPRVDVRNVGEFGIVLDYPSHELPPNTWTRARNVRMKDGSVVPMMGETEYFVESAPVTAPWNIFYCPTSSGVNYWVYGGSDKIGVCNNISAHVDITPAATTLTADDSHRWTGTWLNGVFFMNSANEELLVWDNIDPDAPVLMKRMSSITDTEYQSDWRFNSVRAYKEILIGIGLTVGSADFPTSIVWSGPASAGTVPIAWDAANLNNIAGEQPLSATPGKAIDGMQLGDYFVICKEDATIVCAFSQGASALSFRYIDNTSGVLTINCMVEFVKGKMLIFNQNFDVVVTEGSFVDSILTDRLRENLQERMNVNRAHQSFVVHNPLTQEVWVCYATLDDEDTAGDLCAQEALVWNYQDNTFTFRNLGRISHMAFGRAVDGGTAQVIDDIDLVINQVSTVIDAAGVQSAYSLIGASYPRDSFYKMDFGADIDGTPVYCEFEKSGLALIGQDPKTNQIKVDHRAVKLVTGIWPTFEVQGTSIVAKISVGAQEFRDGPIVWDGPYNFVPGTDQQMDYFVEGIYVTVRFYVESPEFWKFHEYGIELAVVGDKL